MIEYVKVDSCAICGGPLSVRYRGVKDDRYGYPDSFDICECEKCKHAQTSPRIVEEYLSELYSNYYPRNEMDPAELGTLAVDRNNFLTRVRQWLKGENNQGHYRAKQGEVVLDYGCGTGVSLLELKVAGVDGYGVETDKNVEKTASYWGLKVCIGELKDDTYPGIKFNLISLNQVIEHIPEPVKLLQLLEKRLSPGGRIVLSFPNSRSIYRKLFGKKWINWHIPYHLHHFSRASFEKMVENHGWSCRRWSTVTPNLWTLLQLASWRNPQTEEGTKNVWSVDADVPIKTGDGTLVVVRMLIRRIAKKVLLFLIVPVNRLLDLLGQGDSLVVEIRKRG